MADEITDIATTPGWLRPLALAFLLALSGYFWVCYQTPYSDPLPQWQWMGRWKMFTKPSKYHYGLVARAKTDEGWQDVDLLAMFPYQWGSGPRFARNSFWRSSSRVRVLATAICGRHESRPLAVTIVEHRWRVTLGSRNQPKRDLREKVLLESWPCSAKWRLPTGRRL